MFLVGAPYGTPTFILTSNSCLTLDLIPWLRWHLLGAFACCLGVSIGRMAPYGVFRVGFPCGIPSVFLVSNSSDMVS